MQEAAVCWVERDGKVLVVWNRRYRGWTLPGGLVEDGETPPQAMARELFEEAGLVSRATLAPHPTDPIYGAPAEFVADGPKDRGSHVWVFRCDQTIGTAREQEPGCPVMWVTRDEFLALCPFKRFYERMFTKLGWDYAEEVPQSVVKHARSGAHVTALLKGVLVVSELDTPASSLLAPIAKLLKGFGDRQVSLVLASEEPIPKEVTGR